MQNSTKCFINNSGDRNRSTTQLYYFTVAKRKELIVAKQTIAQHYAGWWWCFVSKQMPGEQKTKENENAPWTCLPINVKEKEGVPSTVDSSRQFVWQHIKDTLRRVPPATTTHRPTHLNSCEQSYELILSFWQAEDAGRNTILWTTRSCFDHVVFAELENSVNFPDGQTKTEIAPRLREINRPTDRPTEQTENDLHHISGLPILLFFIITTKNMYVRVRSKN